MHIQNFKLPSSIWREFMRGINLKNKKNQPKYYFFGAVGLKSRDPQKSHLRPPFNVRTKFNVPSSIWWKDRGGTNSRKKFKKRIKKDTFLGCKRTHGIWKVETSKRQLFGSYLSYISNFNIVAEFGLKIGEEQTKKIRKSAQKTILLDLNFPAQFGGWTGEKQPFLKVKKGRRPSYLFSELM